VQNGNGSKLGFEAKLWAAADALRNNMDAAEYKHVVLSLIFLKYISDAFEAKHAELAGQHAQGADPEDPDEYRAVNIFWVPPEARWAYLKSMAPEPTIGQLVDDAKVLGDEAFARSPANSSRPYAQTSPSTGRSATTSARSYAC
jgi:type I restriction enzyme M protein